MGALEATGSWQHSNPTCEHRARQAAQAVIPTLLCVCKETPLPLCHRQTGKLRLEGLER